MKPCAAPAPDATQPEPELGCSALAGPLRSSPSTRSLPRTRPDADRTAQQPNHDRVCSARQTAPRGVGFRCRGSLRGVISLLLSPSASPERVWLYAALLDERLLAPHIPTSTRCSRNSKPTSVISPSVCRHATQRLRQTTVSRHEAHADWPCTPKQLGCKLNDAFRHGPGQSSNRTSIKKLGNVMIALGIILIVLGLLLPSLVPTFAFAHICLVVGVILLVVGLLLMVAGRMGHAVGGRRHYY
jgi:hypothetical protein